jgi:hypothetical protein
MCSGRSRTTASTAALQLGFGSVSRERRGNAGEKEKSTRGKRGAREGLIHGLASSVATGTRTRRANDRGASVATVEKEEDDRVSPFF